VALILKDIIQRGGIGIFSDASPYVLSECLKKLRDVEPERPVVVILEDLDAIISENGESQTLALLDGEKSIDNVVFIATTNYPENLDGRVVNRPSRFDRVIKIDMPSNKAREYYLKERFDLSKEELASWVAASKGFSLAHLKELAISVKCFGNPFEAEVERLKKMAVTPKSGGGKKAGFNEDPFSNG
jgi:SpoVK/Ycf46/Vps4 family AAA+-type ATPase